MREVLALIKSLDSKTKSNIICIYLTIIFLTIFMISIFLQDSITFTKPIFLTIWSGMCLSNVAIFWSVTSVTEYMNLKEEENNGTK